MHEFYILLIASSLILTLLSLICDIKSEKFYLLVTLYFLVLCICKPVGISADDKNYIAILNALNENSLEGSHGIGDTRDYIWVHLVYILGLGSYGFVGVKLLAGLSFLVKTYVIKKYCKNYLFALSIYISTFFILHETIQYRVSFAVCLLFIFILIFEKTILRLLIFVIAIFSHLQAAVMILPILLKKIKIYKYFSLAILTALILPNIINFFSLQFNLVEILNSIDDNKLTIYIKRYSEQIDGADVNSISYILLGIILIIAYKKIEIPERDICFNVVLASFLCYGLLYGLPDLRWRLADFLITPVCMIAGNAMGGPLIKLLFIFYANLLMYKQILIL